MHRTLKNGHFVITLSQIVVIGILEAFGVLVLGLLLLLVLNRRLHKRRGSLASQLSQLKETTFFLLDKVDQYSSRTYGFFLDQAVEEAKSKTAESPATMDQSFNTSQTEPEKASVIRYLLLEAELAAEAETDERVKATLLASHLEAIVQDFEASSSAPVEVIKEQDDLFDNEDFRNKWGYLCDAAQELISSRSIQSADDLINIIQTLSTDLDLGDIAVPSRGQSVTGTAEHVREESNRSKALITKLLNERDAAAAAVNMTVTELEKLQRFLKESEVCVAQLESDFESAQMEIKKLKANSSDDPDEMQRTIDRYTQESTEMMICIETLEQENSELKNQL